MKILGTKVINSKQIKRKNKAYLNNLEKTISNKKEF